MKRIIRRIVTVVTTETWSVVEDVEHERPDSADYTSTVSLTEGEDTGHTPALSDESHEYTETLVSDNRKDLDEEGHGI